MSKIDRKIISIVVIAILVLSVLMPTISFAAATDTVEIKDAALKQQVLFYADLNDDGILTKKEMENLDHLYIPSSVADFSGLEYATNLEDIRYTVLNEIPDLTPISHVPYLGLEFSNDGTIDLNSLKVMKKLEYLSISAYGENVNVTDYSVLAEIETLTSLDIFGDIIPTNMDQLKKITSLKELYLATGSETRPELDLTDISKLTNLVSLWISAVNLKNVSEISKVEKLDYLYLSSVNGVADLSSLTKNKKLESLALENVDAQDISFLKNCETIKSLELYNMTVKDINVIEEIDTLEFLYMYNITLSGSDQYKNIGFKEYTAYIGETGYVQTTFLDHPVDMVDMFTYTSDSDVLTISEDGTFKAEDLGEATITATCKEDSNIKKTFKIKVTGISAEQSLGTELGSSFVGEDHILKANGELWKVYALDKKAQKVATDVKKVVFDVVYNQNRVQKHGFHYSLLLKEDGTVDYTFNGVTTKITDAKDIYQNGYLKKDGTYVTINLDGTWETVTNNVEKIVGSYLVKNDGKTYTVGNRLVADFAIVDASYEWIVDENGTLWRVGVSVENLEECDTEFDHFVNSETYMDKNGVLKSVWGYEEEWIQTDSYHELCLAADGKLYLGDKLILTNVVSFDADVDMNTDQFEYKTIIVREDASIWILLLEGKGELVKVEETSNVYFKEDLEVKTIVEKWGTVQTLSGFDMKDLSVENALKDVLKSGYTAKVYSDAGKELGDKDNMRTGAVIKIYNSKGEMVNSFTAIVYGDTTGSGKPSSKDALKIIKNKLGEIKLEGVYLEAGRMSDKARQTGATPSATDALSIIKARLGN